jgi:hypothetical protein
MPWFRSRRSRIPDMKISGPEHFKLTFDEKKFKAKFSGLANTKLPKLYVVVSDGEIIYVGITKSTMRQRLYGGWSARGKNGYYGYAFRKTHTEADLYVWYHKDAAKRSSLDVETVEAEVAFLIRKAGRWPVSQTEIHFHPSIKEHRELAARIVQHVSVLAGNSNSARRVCECGCGENPKNPKSRFLPGHDLRKAYNVANNTLHRTKRATRVRPSPEDQGRRDGRIR